MTLQALRQRIGEEPFWRLLRTWLQQEAGGNATTQDFEALAASISGQDLTSLLHRLAAHPGQAGPHRRQRAFMSTSTTIDWFRKPADSPADGTLNACYNALDRHVIRGRPRRSRSPWTPGPGRTPSC